MHPIVSRRQAAGGQKLRLLQIGADYSLWPRSARRSMPLRR
jgi:hypothetical protein